MQAFQKVLARQGLQDTVTAVGVLTNKQPSTCQGPGSPVIHTPSNARPEGSVDPQLNELNSVTGAMVRGAVADPGLFVFVCFLLIFDTRERNLGLSMKQASTERVGSRVLLTGLRGLKRVRLMSLSHPHRHG